MNITLSAPPAVIQEVRAWAEHCGTSMNEYIRECLERKAAEIKSERLTRAQEFRQFAMANAIPLGKGFKWSRKLASERSLKCEV